VSSIGEVRRALATSSQRAGDARGAVGAAMQAVGEAISLLQQAAGESGHPKIAEALAGYEECRQKLGESSSLLGGARSATDDYSGVL
jgi:hypothetical protein